MKKWGKLGLAIVAIGLLVGCQTHGLPKSVKPSQRQSTTKATPAQSVSKPKAASKPAVETIVTRLKDRPGQRLIYAPLGDSLSVGLFADSKSQRFTSLFANQLSTKTGKQVEEKGAAIVGKTATNFGIYQLTNIVAQKPDIVTIEFGTNDAVGGASEQALTQYQISLTTIVSSLQQETSAQLILMTTWSPNNGQYQTADFAFDRICAEVGQKFNVPVVNLATIWQGHNEVTGPAGTLIPDFATWGARDNFHPNQLGHTRIADALMSVSSQPLHKE